MRIKATNTGNVPVALPGTGITVGPGQTKVASGQSKSVVAQCLGVASRTFLVQAELDPADHDVVYVDLKSPADPAADAVFVAAVGFQLKNAAGSSVSLAEKVGFAVYDDANYTQPSADVALSTATAGSITKGSGTSAIEVTASSTGEFACRATIPTAEARTVYFKAFMIAGGTRVLDTSDTDAVDFTVS